MTTNLQRTTLIGATILEGTAKTTGKAYSFAKLYAMYPQTGTGVYGYQSAEMNCDVSVARKLENVVFPIDCDLEIANVMSYGKLQQQIMSISPVGQTQPKTPAKA